MKQSIAICGLDWEKRYQYVTLRDRPDLKDAAATWFHGKWNVPKEAYLGEPEEFRLYILK